MSVACDACIGARPTRCSCVGGTADGPGWVGTSWTGVGRWAGLGAVASRFRLVCIATDVAAVCTFSRALPLARVAIPHAPGFLVTRPSPCGSHPRLQNGTRNMQPDVLGHAQLFGRCTMSGKTCEHAQWLAICTITGDMVNQWACGWPSNGDFLALAGTTAQQ